MNSIVDLPRPAMGDALSPDSLHGAEAAGLLARFGSPLFVVFEEVLRGRFRALSFAFGAGGRETAIAYSYKTNYLPAVCAILHQEGAWAEVVSGVEYALARALGCPPEKIVFNGPAKTGPDLETALNEGALVVVDSFDEMATVRALAATAGKPFRIGLRIGLEPRESPWSRFGFSAETGEAVLAMRRAATSGLSIEMLHNHGGTDRADPGPYVRAAESLGSLAQTAAELGHAVTRIDLGGGFATNVAAATYAEPVLAVLDRFRERTGRAMGLVIEPGRAVVDPAVVLLATVMAVKAGAGARRAVTLDAGINLLPPACRARPRTVRVLASKALHQAGLPTDVFGPLCMPQDLVAEGAALPPLNPGDIVAIEETGAYTISQSMQFIAPRPAVVLMSAEGEAPIRRREDWRDVFALDALPNRLWPKGADF